MKIKNLIIMCILIVSLVGCDIKSDEKCYYFDTYESTTYHYFKYDCECVSEQNEYYNFSMDGLPRNPNIKFEDKKNLAMIDDKWFCKCNKEYEVETFEWDDWDSPDFYKDCSHLENRKLKEKYNKTDTEKFTWSY